MIIFEKDRKHFFVYKVKSLIEEPSIFCTITLGSLLNPEDDYFDKVLVKQICVQFFIELLFIY